MNYLIRLRGHQQGPFTAEQLQKLASRGRFSRLYEVSTDNGQLWQRAERFPELFPPPPVPKARLIQQQPVSVTPNEDDGLRLQPDEEPAVEWYYTRGGEELGPVTAVQLKQLIGIGDVLPDDYVWTEALDNWQRVADVPEFSQQLARPTNLQVTPASQPSGAVPPMAVASLVLGLLGFTIIGAILAIVFGHVAMAQIRQAKGALGGKGLALAGLILGYLVLIPAVITGIVYVAILLLAPTGVKTPTVPPPTAEYAPRSFLVASVTP